MEIQLAVAKIEKYAMSESGDTVEVVERPHGGVSVVLVDGQRSGRSAKMISNIVARKAISLLAEGVRDGAAARAAHDYLRTHRGGKVSAEMIILSADMDTGTAVVSRNTQTPVAILEGGEWRLLDAPTEAIGIYKRTRPQIVELPLRPGLTAVAFSDGVWRAGERRGGRLDVLGLLRSLPLTLGARAYADELLAHALQREEGRPSDDLTVVAMHISGIATDAVRRMSMTLPVPPRLYQAWRRL
ncbi:MAG TPA: serine/threonine-protein phosphatase [Anaerolineae bacterium]|nr:serine/threonine-protein phosphatase [Anaerolineae bacterium]